MSKKIILSLLVVILAIILISIKLLKVSDGIVVKDVPWLINSENPQQTNVLSLHIGVDDLATTTENIKKIPEVAAFKSPDESYLIEAYFSRVKQGPLQGSLATEVDVEGIDLTGYARFDQTGKPMPSGKRKYVLSKTGIMGANKLRVWKLAYLPSTDYSIEELTRLFGEPKRKQTVTSNVENWYYPEKGLIITYDKENHEVFYYSARAEYERLIKAITDQQSIASPTAEGSKNHE